MLGSLSLCWVVASGVCAPEELAVDNRHTCSKFAASLGRVEDFFTTAVAIRNGGRRLDYLTAWWAKTEIRTNRVILYANPINETAN